MIFTSSRKPLVKGFYGKLPLNREYIQHNKHLLEIRQLTQWIDEGSSYIRTRYGKSAWVEDLQYNFLYTPREGNNSVIGIIRYSSDGSRIYPFVVFILFKSKKIRDYPSIIPFIFEGVWGRLNAFLKEDFDSIQSFMSSFNKIKVLPPDNMRSLQNEYMDTRLNWKGLNLWDSLFMGDQEKKSVLFKNLLTIGNRYRGETQAHLTALRFPLKKNEIPACVQVTFWLEMVLRMLGIRNANFSFFFSVPVAVDGRDYFFLFFRHPQAADFVNLMTLDYESEGINILEDNWGLKYSENTLPKNLRDILESETITLSEIIKRTS